MPSQVQRAILALARLCLIGTGVVSLLGLMGRWYWVLDLFGHFRVQYLLLLAVAGVALALQKQWRWSAAAALLCVLNLALIMPLYLRTPEASASEADALSLVVFNVNYKNDNDEAIANYLADADVDLVVILEATRSMEAAMSKRLPSYRRFAEAREDAFGILAYSRLALVTQRTRYLGDTALPSLDFAVEKAGRSYAILALHTMPPVGLAQSAMRDRMLVDAATWATGKDNALIVGDFNATPWSYVFSDLIDVGKLTNSQCGFGIQSSWPAGLWPLQIPIDHALHGPALTTIDRFVGPFLGSDHRPLHLRIGAAR